MDRDQRAEAASSLLPGYMYLESEPLGESAASLPSEKPRTIRIGTVSKSESAQSRNGTHVTFARRQLFTTLHLPLEKHAAP